MLLHIACSVWLRSMGLDSTLIAELFGLPLLARNTTKRWLLRGKYFLPWVRGPVDLTESSLLPRLLFLGARLGAMLLVLGMIAFFARAFWVAAHQ
jgi:hypothetical protein